MIAHNHSPSLLWTALSRLLRPWQALPVNCLICGRSGRYDANLCRQCMDALPRVPRPCPGCGLTLSSRHAAPLCGTCLIRPPSFDFCRGLFIYTPPVSELVTGFKFHHRFDMGFALSRLLAEAIATFYPESNRPQLLVPVPLHRQRLRQRGFNQAREIGRVVARHCRLPLADDIVERHRPTAPQSGQGPLSARRRNISSAFRLRDAAILENVNHITLIDDVVTSMATANALSRCLKAQGIRRIDVWCLARVSREGHR